MFFSFGRSHPSIQFGVRELVHYLSLFRRHHEYSSGVSHDAKTFLTEIISETYQFHGHPALQIGVQSNHRARTQNSLQKVKEPEVRFEVSDFPLICCLET